MNLEIPVWPGWNTVKVLGRGSFGGVYEIERDFYGDIEKAALKVIDIPQNEYEIEEMRNDGYDDASITATFNDQLQCIVREYTMMKKLNGNTNVVNCDDVYVTDHVDGIGKTIMIKMELLTALNKVVSTMDPVSLAIKVGRDICKALILCEGKNIVHRDIKPQNIFVSDTGDFKLGDFGVSRTMERTTGGTKIGTPDYMAPEVFRGDPYNHTADIYSLGIVMYWILNNRRTPFLPQPPAVPSMSDKERARALRMAGAEIPEPVNGSAELIRVVLKACSYDPQDRYQSAAEMREELGMLKAVTLSQSAPALNPLVLEPERDDKRETGDSRTVLLVENQMPADDDNRTTSLFQVYSQNHEELSAVKEALDEYEISEHQNCATLASLGQPGYVLPEEDEETIEPIDGKVAESVGIGDEEEYENKTKPENKCEKRKQDTKGKKRTSDLIKTILIIALTAGAIYLWSLYPPVSDGILIGVITAALCMILAMIADNIPLLLFAAVCCAVELLAVLFGGLEVAIWVVAFIAVLDIIVTSIVDSFRSLKAFPAIMAVTILSYGLWNCAWYGLYANSEERIFPDVADTSSQAEQIGNLNTAAYTTEEWQDDGNRIVYSFNSQGQLVYAELYDEEGSLILWVKQEYDANGNCTLEESCCLDETFEDEAETRYEHYFDESGYEWRTVEYIRYYDGPEVYEVWENEQEIEERRTNPDGTYEMWEIYEYDANGRCISATCGTGSGEPDSRSVWAYYDSGALLSEDYAEMDDGTYIYRAYYENFPDGNMSVKELSYYTEGICTETFRYEYYIDDFLGNQLWLIRSTVYDDGYALSENECSFTYNEDGSLAMMELCAYDGNGKPTSEARMTGSYIPLDYNVMEPLGILVRREDLAKYRKLKDFASAVVGVQLNTTTEAVVLSEMPDSFIYQERVVAELLNALASGEIDAVVLDGVTAQHYAEKYDYFAEAGAAVYLR